MVALDFTIDLILANLGRSSTPPLP